MNPAVVPTLMVTFDLESRDYTHGQFFYDLINNELASGYVGPFRATQQGYSFRSIYGELHVFVAIN